MKKIFFNLIKRIRKLLSWLWEQEGSPSQRAVGFGLGVFSGCFPFFGFQTVIGIILAKIFKGNSVLAALGTWISNPFTYVPLYIFNYRVGALLLHTDNNIVDFTHITTKDVWSQGWYLSSRLMMGSICIGLISGVVGGICLYFSLKKFSNMN
tara:strand:+ start:116 stop:571 length:456 start_codon:yes stop_codon:yes gene_type:complete